MSGCRNFIISSGCDIPPGTGRANFDVFFNTVSVYNEGRTTAINRGIRDVLNTIFLLHL